MLARNPGVRDLALTTNGVLLAKQAASLKQAGLGRVTVSPGTLRPDPMREPARSDPHAHAVDGASVGRAAGFRLKLNTLVIPRPNGNEVRDLIRLYTAHQS